jgi:hypothetical protein
LSYFPFPSTDAAVSVPNYSFSWSRRWTCIARVSPYSPGRWRRPSRHRGSSARSSVWRLLVEIGPEGWTLTQQPPFLSHSLLTTAKSTTATSAKKEDAETKQHKENTREHLADRRPKELRLPLVLSSHYSVSVSL